MLVLVVVVLIGFRSESVKGDGEDRTTQEEG